MRRIEYPDDIGKLKSEYAAIFSDYIDDMQSEWEPLRDSLRSLGVNSETSHRVYPDRIEDIIKADYELLVDMFLNYQGLKEHYSYFMEDFDTKLKKLFHYSGVENSDFPAFQPSISEFFMKHQKELKTDVCYYCELSYINTYGFKTQHHDVGSFLLNATRHQIERYVRNKNGEPLSERTYNKIMALRKRAGVDETNVEDEFKKIDYRWNGTEKKSEGLKERMHNHFDLDHFLPKSKCPLVGLSLMNFVPSCPVCNEKLKGSDILWGEDKAKRKEVLLKVSPISRAYRLSDVAQIRLRDKGKGWLRAQEHPDDYEIDFSSDDDDYQTEVIEEFHLDERYAYHKCEALRWYDLKHDYPPTRIKEMAKALGGYKTEEQLQNDIFQNDYFESNVRCFDKLRRDILGL